MEMIRLTWIRHDYITLCMIQYGIHIMIDTLTVHAYESFLAFHEGRKDLPPCTCLKHVVPIVNKPNDIVNLTNWDSTRFEWHVGTIIFFLFIVYGIKYSIKKWTQSFTHCRIENRCAEYCQKEDMVILILLIKNGQLTWKLKANVNIKVKLHLSQWSLVDFTIVLSKFNL